MGEVAPLLGWVFLHLWVCWVPDSVTRIYSGSSLRRPATVPQDPLEVCRIPSGPGGAHCPLLSCGRVSLLA